MHKLDAIEMSKGFTAALVLSVIAGILIWINCILLGSEIGTLMLLYSGAVGVNALVLSIPPSLLYVFIAVGVVLGLLVLLGALMAYHSPSRKAWGALVLICSILSVIIGAGFLFGMILGLIGGLVSLTLKPKVAKA